jgi:hypothetical protein
VPAGNGKNTAAGPVRDHQDEVFDFFLGICGRGKHNYDEITSE